MTCCGGQHVRLVREGIRLMRRSLRRANSAGERASIAGASFPRVGDLDRECTLLRGPAGAAPKASQGACWSSATATDRQTVAQPPGRHPFRGDTLRPVACARSTCIGQSHRSPADSPFAPTSHRPPCPTSIAHRIVCQIHLECQTRPSDPDIDVSMWMFQQGPVRFERRHTDMSRLA